LHKFLPSSSFPSDHAALSMAIAMGTLVWWILHKDKKLVWISIPFILFSLIMSFCRVTSGIHWPTDVIGGTLVGLFVPLLMWNNKKIFWLFKKVWSWIAKKI
jgi:undecaprenyl-diphosphatase